MNKPIKFEIFEIDESFIISFNDMMRGKKYNYSGYGDIKSTMSEVAFSMKYMKHIESSLLKIKVLAIIHLFLPRYKDRVSLSIGDLGLIFNIRDTTCNTTDLFNDLMSIELKPFDFESNFYDVRFGPITSRNNRINDILE